MTATATAPKTHIEKFRTREQWLHARNNGPEGPRVSASEVATILGRNPYKSPLRYYHELRGDLPPENLDDNIAVQCGLATEQVNRDIYAARTGRAVDPGSEPGHYSIIVNSDTPFVIASLDGEVCDDSRGGLGVWEGKFISRPRGEEWEHEPPIHMQVQVQTQLAVTGYGWGSVSAIFAGRDWTYFDLDRNDRFIKLALAQCAEFVDRVKTGHAPEPTAGADDSKLLKMLYPVSDGKALILPDEFAAIHADIAGLTSAAKNATEEAENLKARVLAAMGDAEVAHLPDGTVGWTRKKIKRSGYTVQPTEFIQLTTKKRKD